MASSWGRVDKSGQTLKLKLPNNSYDDGYAAVFSYFLQRTECNLLLY